MIKIDTLENINIINEHMGGIVSKGEIAGQVCVPNGNKSNEKLCTISVGVGVATTALNASIYVDNDGCRHSKDKLRNITIYPLYVRKNAVDSVHDKGSMMMTLTRSYTLLDVDCHSFPRDLLLWL